MNDKVWERIGTSARSLKNLASLKYFKFSKRRRRAEDACQLGREGIRKKKIKWKLWFNGEWIRGKVGEEAELDTRLIRTSTQTRHNKGEKKTGSST